MPRANRHFLQGHVWHITHRCHNREFLLKFKSDRQQWIRWLGEARRRYHLCVLNYVVTCNHIHLLVLDQGHGEIAKSLQLVAGCTAQQFNRRKKRKGAFWEDRYFATAVQQDSHLARCLVYIDLNMVRAGVVSHPDAWQHGGYREIQSAPERYRVIDTDNLMRLFGVDNLEQFRSVHRGWVQTSVDQGDTQRQPYWTESIAVGHPDYLQRLKQELGHRGRQKNVTSGDDGHCLNDNAAAYTEDLGS